jgi:hypothetical protein
MGARSARTCSRPLSSARPGTVLTWARTHSCRLLLSETIPGGQGVAGSNPAVPTQVSGWFRVAGVAFLSRWERTCAPIRGADQAVWRVLPCRRPDLRILAIIHVLPWVALPIATGVNFPRVKGSPIQRPGRDPPLPPFSVLCTGRFLRCVCGIRLAASTGTPHSSRRLSELAGGPVTAPVGQGLAAGQSARMSPAASAGSPPGPRSESPATA